MALLFFQINFLSGIFSVVYTPILLDFADEKALGLALSVGSLGMILGSFLSFRIKTVDKYTFLLFLIMANGFFEIITSYKEIKAFIGSCTLFIEDANNIKKYDLENNHVIEDSIQGKVQIKNAKIEDILVLLNKPVYAKGDLNIIADIKNASL